MECHGVIYDQDHECLASSCRVNHPVGANASGCLPRRGWKAVFAMLVFVALFAPGVHAAVDRLTWRFVDSVATRSNPGDHPADLLPHSEPTAGTQDIARAWLADPTGRYPHGVLGDRLEAGTLVAETRDGDELRFELPEHRVFEDLEVRLVDLDGDGRDEMLVVESDVELGAALAIFGIVDERIERLAATAFIGQRNRWLNPLGVGDFDGDGRLDVALVATPHIGGILRLYRFEAHQPTLFAEYRGVSTHAIGMAELGLGSVVRGAPRDRILIPEQALNAFQLLEWTPEGWQVLARTVIPGRMNSSLRAVGDDRWQFDLTDGRTLELELELELER